MDHQPLLPWKHSRLGPGLAWGDANGDGDPDLFVGGAAGQSGRLYVNRDGKLVQRKRRGPWKMDAGHEDMGVIWVDVNGDGDSDLYVASGSSEHRPGSSELGDRVYLNNGAGRFRLAPAKVLPEDRTFSGTVCSVDYDRDGDSDLFVGGRMVPRHYPDSPPSRLLENRNGRFVDITDEVAPELAKAGMVTGALWTDVNGDGWMDLMVVLEWGPIRYFENQDGTKLVEKTADVGLSESSGLWNGITGTDVNGDGRMDYVVSNFGRNSRYHASANRPYVLYAGDLDGDGDRELVEALYQGETLYPVRGRDMLARVMPFVESKFETYKTYSEATLSDIVPEKRLGRARRLEVRRLSSVILENREGRDGGVQFRVQPLPQEAQLSPGFGVVTSSFDEKPGPDLLMAQNFFGTESWITTGRIDGGVGVLFGGGSSGSFRAMSAKKSGLFLRGDMKAAANADVNGDGRPDVVIARNNGKQVLLTHRSDEEASPLEIRFARPDKTTIAGTRVTGVVNGSVQWSREVYAGSGYLSQSFPRLYVTPAPDRSEITLRVRWPDGTTTRRTVRDPHGKQIICRP